MASGAVVLNDLIVFLISSGLGVYDDTSYVGIGLVSASSAIKVFQPSLETSFEGVHHFIAYIPAHLTNTGLFCFGVVD